MPRKGAQSRCSQSSFKRVRKCPYGSSGIEKGGQGAEELETWVILSIPEMLASEGSLLTATLRYPSPPNSLEARFAV